VTWNKGIKVANQLIFEMGYYPDGPNANTRGLRLGQGRQKREPGRWFLRNWHDTAGFEGRGMAASQGGWKNKEIDSALETPQRKEALKTPWF
jgi:hypothetical protein